VLNNGTEKQGFKNDYCGDVHMGLIDNRGRLFGRINVIDFIVIVVVILFLAGVAYTRLKPGNLQGIEPTTIEVTFLVPNVRGPSINAPELGDIVREE
jgi:hypothetical protein